MPSPRLFNVCETAACETDREADVSNTQEKQTMLPMQDHPLTLAYIAGTRAHTQESIRENMRLVFSLEKDASETLLAQCRLAAEVLIERKMA